MCDTSETMDTRSEPSQGTDADGDDDISVGSHSPPPRNDTDDSMIDVDDTVDDDSREKVTASPKVEPPDPAMSPGPPRTPPVAHQANNAVIHRSLKFSIDNILKPDFGRRLGDAVETSDQPVDLSRVTNRGDPKKVFGDPARSLGEVGQAPNSVLLKDREGGGGTLWPAWVYCTRYSDRPSADNIKNIVTIKRYNNNQKRVTETDIDRQRRRLIAIDKQINRDNDRQRQRN
ncbi:homeobox protein engrailed-1a [Procambarus clarkii]|uniref:homeobox protein engrailed-1a n=1 Tax=Procambarus clarkii TaxID=6728 RepID=UPI001E67252B|nr:homeobox protein engrailed-1a-like [Procambarus clarkii]